MSILARLPALLAVACAVALPASAQRPSVKPLGLPAVDTSKPATPAADTTPQTVAPSDIPGEADRTITRAFDLSNAGSGADADDALRGIAAMVDTLKREERIGDLSQVHLLTRRGISDLAVTWRARDLQVRLWRNTLQERMAQVDSARGELARATLRWRMTSERQDSGVGKELKARTLDVVGELRRVDSGLAQRATRLLDGELALSDASKTILTELQGISAAQDVMRHELFRLDSPPLWRSVEATATLSTSKRGGIASAVSELAWFVKGNAEKLILHTIIVLVLMLAAVSGRERVQSAAESSDTLGEHYAVLRRPIAALLLVSFTLTMLLYPRAPLALYDAALLLSALPLLALIPELIPADLHGSARTAVALLVLQRLVAMATVGQPSYRLAQLAISLVGAFVLWRALRPTGPLRKSTPPWRLQLQRLGWVLLGAFVLAIGSNVLGNVTLADSINAGVALSLFIAILLRAVTQVVDVFASAAVRAGARGSRYLAERGARVERIGVTTVNVLAFLAWAALTLQSFFLWDPIAGVVSRVLSARYTVGHVSLSLGTVLLFVAVLLVGMLTARVIAGLVEFDVMGRMDLRRGVSVTVGSLLRYALIAVAFFIALASAGVELGSLAILGGALGVGIGFGLQNIVNNFISGVLLAFERPVGIGDTVQVGTNTGEVKEIGIRASIIRTFEGAEVIVPNSELITKDVINWTRSGTRRRFEIAVGVAYGNDPARIISLLTDAALQHPDVRGNPKPFTLFVGFGESSLDFLVRAWTDATDWGVVRSDVAVAIHAALTSAGIEIPFPQRDVNVRGLDADTLKDLRGEATQA